MLHYRYRLRHYMSLSTKDGCESANRDTDYHNNITSCDGFPIWAELLLVFLACSIYVITPTLTLYHPQQLQTVPWQCWPCQDPGLPSSKPSSLQGHFAWPLWSLISSSPLTPVSIPLFQHLTFPQWLAGVACGFSQWIDISGSIQGAVSQTGLQETHSNHSLSPTSHPLPPPPHSSSLSHNPSRFKRPKGTDWICNLAGQIKPIIYYSAMQELTKNGIRSLV